MSEQVQPPYVEFVTKSIENRTASIAQGHYVGEDVDFAIITARGSRDRVEHEIATWFSKIDLDVRDGRIPAGWASQWKEAYKYWKNGQSTPENGTSIKDWPVLSVSQVQTLLSLHVTTIEALAECNEETMQRLGIGARTLRQKAVDWLKASHSTGKVTEELGALRIKLSELETENKTMAAKLQIFEAQQAAQTAKAG